MIVNRSNTCESEEEEEEKGMANEKTGGKVKFNLEEDDTLGEQPASRFRLQGSGSTSSLEGGSDGDNSPSDASAIESSQHPLSMK